MLHPTDLKHRLCGALAFAPTPFRPNDSEIDLPGFRRNMDCLAQNRMPAVCVAGFVGEYSALTPGEYTELVKTAAGITKGRSLLVAGAGGGTRLACEAAKAGQDNGADCIMILPPYLVQPTTAGLIEHFRAIAQSVQVGVMIHSMPGISFTPELVETMTTVPNIIAYKDELGDLRGFGEIVDRVGDRLAYVNAGGVFETRDPETEHEGCQCRNPAGSY